MLHFDISSMKYFGKVPVRFLESLSYLTAQLRWHLSNMKAIFNKLPSILTTVNNREITERRKFVSWPPPPPPMLMLMIVVCKPIFTPQPLMARGYCRRPSGRSVDRAAGQISPVNTLTSIIFHGSFSNLARTFITLRSRTSSMMEVLPH